LVFKSVFKQNELISNICLKNCVEPVWWPQQEAPHKACNGH
jgi:hypothetical protein